MSKYNYSGYPMIYTFNLVHTPGFLSTHSCPSIPISTSSTTTPITPFVVPSHPFPQPTTFFQISLTTTVPLLLVADLIVEAKFQVPTTMNVSSIAAEIIISSFFVRDLGTMIL